MRSLEPSGRLSAINWEDWTPTDHATLLFVIQEGRILLIRKKRGLGAGKINGPGGRVEAGETPAEGALRELEEELCIVGGAPTWCGHHQFEFTDGYRLFVEVFKTNEYRGEPAETEEAIPLWFDVDKIPFDEMWADDIYWFPHLLAGRHFRGKYLFRDDQMLDLELTVDQDEGPPLVESFSATDASP